ncbi:MAG: hypothetical protein WEA11_05155 [Acidimicrobiales bacterium]
MENSPFEPVKRATHEVLSVSLGLGILGFQRLQVQRREWERSTGASLPDPAHCAERMNAAMSTLSRLFAAAGRR